MNYLQYTHTDTNLSTVGKFFNKTFPLVTGISIFKFLKFTGDSNKTNVERIFEKFIEPEKTRYQELVSSILNWEGEEGYLEGDILPLYPGTELILPKNDIVSELISIRGKNLFLEQTESKFFFSDKLLQLLNDPKYVRSENISLEGREVTIEIKNENVQIWLWSRALEKIINLSPFIQSVVLQKGEVGNFNFSLNPVHGLDDVEFFNESDVLNYFVLNSENKSNLDFFYKNIQYNDIVFIRLEKLEIEKEQSQQFSSNKSNKDSYENSFTVNQAQLPGQVWDMIGLVDSVTQSSSYQQDADYTINVSGRDFMKLLIEDGSYFLSIRYLNNGESNFVFAYNREGKWFKRNILDKGSDQGSFKNYWFPNSARSINDTIGFVINQLSNLGVLPDNQDIFSNYDSVDEKKRRRTRALVISDDGSSVKDNLVNGVWQIIKILFDRSLDNRRVSDQSISYVDSTILEQFNKICQKPFVEFFGDTYGDEYAFVIRQLPFNKDSIQSFLRGDFQIYLEDDSRFTNPTNSNFDVEIRHKKSYDIITLEEKDIEGYNSMEWDQTYYSWYQLTPQDNMLGEYSELMAGGFIPIVYFDELTQFFGNKRLCINDNYLSAGVISASESTEDRESYKKALLNDLKYVIDCNSYLPFTRKGSIVIPGGDRRIKRGTFIRINPTREIFYVDSVSHSLQFSKNRVDRSTTLQLSRGMLEEYIFEGVGFENNGKQIFEDRIEGINSKKFSYFKIIETELKRVPYSRTITEEVKNDYKSTQGFKYSVVIPKSSRVAFVHNNPGNLMYVGQPDATIGESRGKGNWAKFATPEIGFENVIRQIEIDTNKGLTLRQFIYKYAPPTDNNPTPSYLRNIVSMLNQAPDTSLKNIDHFDLAVIICQKESSTKVRRVISEDVEKVEEQVEQKSIVESGFEYKFFHKLNLDQLDFFIKRKQFNFLKYARRS